MILRDEREGICIRERDGERREILNTRSMLLYKEKCGKFNEAEIMVIFLLPRVLVIPSTVLAF